MNREFPPETSLPIIPVTVRWENRAVPPELREEASRLLGSRRPRVYRERIEKIQVATGKGVRWKSKVVREPVNAPGPPRFQGYARAGETVALLAYGESPAPAGGGCAGGGSGELCLGDHLRESAGTVQAERDGFFRVGPDWVELLPYIPWSWEIAAGADPADCRLVLTPGSPDASPPPASRVLAAAEALGFRRGELLAEEELAELLRRAQEEAGREGGAAPAKGPCRQNRSISRREDAEVRIEVPGNAMAALLSLRKGRGEGRPLTLKEIGDAVRACRFKGLNVERVRADLLAFHRGPQRLLDRYVLLEGRKPGRGNDGSIQWAVPFLDAARTEELKARALARRDLLAGLGSLDTLPIEAVQDMALVKERVRVAEFVPATVGEAGADVYGNPVAGLKGEEPRLELLEGLVLMRHEVVSRHAGVLERTRRGGAVLLRVRPHQDGEAQVRVCEDRMTATLTLIPAEGTGREIEPQAVERALEEAGVQAGVDREAIARAVLEARGGRPVRDLPVARGTPARHGPDRSLRFLVQVASGKGVTLTREGRADYKRQDRITSVEAGSPVAEIPPQGESRDGVDVTGRVLAAQTDRPPEPAAGRGVRREEAPDGTVRFVSTLAGELLYNGTVLDVVQVHTIQGDVGLASGNIRFSGSVRVGGSVQSGFGVVAEGGILVGESVYGSLLSAGEDIQVAGGVKGAGKGILRAKRDIRCLFAEQASLLGASDIRIRNAALHCTIKCNGRLTLESDRGHLIGGQARARYGLSVMNLGSEREVQTVVSFGQDYLIADRIELLEKEAEAQKEELRQVDEELRRRMKLDAGSRALEELHRRKVALLKAGEKRRQRLFQLRERFEQHFPSEVAVRGTAFPGVVLESHGRTYRITVARRQVRFLFSPEKGRIEEAPLAGR